MSNDCRAEVRQSSLFKEDSYHSSKPHCSLCIRPNPGILLQPHASFASGDHGKNTINGGWHISQV